jgi:hypothetical protein
MSNLRSVLDVPISLKVYALYKLLHSFHSTIPKVERYTLWQKCENTTLALLEILIETGPCNENKRKELLYALSGKLDLLKVLIRLSKETHTIDQQQYLAIQELLQEIGKMLGGWIKYSANS